MNINKKVTVFCLGVAFVGLAIVVAGQVKRK